jgi:hypothetical protein
MNVLLFVAGALTGLLGAAHSLLGERLLLGPLFKHSDLPELLGSRLFARRTLRFAWHLTTVLLAGIGLLVVALSFTQVEPQTVWLLRCFSIVFAICSIVSLVGARARHFSWIVFLVIAAMLWLGVS